MTQQSSNFSGANLKEIIAQLHPNLRHIHWTTDVKEKGGNVIGKTHHHFLFEVGEQTGLYGKGSEARNRFAELLVSYYPDLHGALVPFGGRRGFDVRTVISDEEKRERARTAAEQDEKGKRKRGKKGKSESNEAWGLDEAA